MAGGGGAACRAEGGHGGRRCCAGAGKWGRPAARQVALRPGTAAVPRGAAQGSAEAACGSARERNRGTAPRDGRNRGTVSAQLGLVR